MSRAQRLLDLVQILRSHRFPVAGALLATRLGISLRTLYRDIATLQHQGAPIEGEAGVGYILRAGYILPPLMFDENELEALALGALWVEKRGDPTLAQAARSTLSRIAAVLPEERKEFLQNSALLIGPSAAQRPNSDSALIRHAIRHEKKLYIHYQSLKEEQSQRMVWPFAMGFFDATLLMVAWCEMRQQYRSFRVDRLLFVQEQEERYPRRRHVLLKEWRALEKIPPPSDIVLTQTVSKP